MEGCIFCSSLRRSTSMSRSRVRCSSPCASWKSKARLRTEGLLSYLQATEGPGKDVIERVVHVCSEEMAAVTQSLKAVTETE